MRHMFSQCISSGICPPPCPHSGMPSAPNSGPPVNDPFYSSPFSPYTRRHTPCFGSPDYRIYEINKKLQQRIEVRLLNNFASFF